MKILKGNFKAEGEIINLIFTHQGMGISFLKFDYTRIYILDFLNTKTYFLFSISEKVDATGKKNEFDCQIYKM